MVCELVVAMNQVTLRLQGGNSSRVETIQLIAGFQQLTIAAISILGKYRPQFIIHNVQ